MAEGLGEVVLGIRVDADQANAGLDRFKQSAIRAAQEASQALSRVGGGNTATIAPKLDLSSINEYAKRLASLDTSVDSPKIDLTSIREGIAEALELKRKIDQLDGLNAKASAEFIVTGLDSGNIANSLKNLQQALQAVGTTQVSVSIDSAEFKEATQQAVGLEQRLQDIEKRKAVITAEFILKGLQEGTITQSIGNVRRALEQLNTAQVAVSVDSSEFVELGRRIAAEEQRLQRLENEQTKIKVQYLVEGLNDGQVTQSIQNLRQALQGLGNVQASVDVSSDDFVRITQEFAKLQQDIDRVDGRKAVITADFLIRGLNDGTISQSISNVRKALEGLNNAQVVVDVDSSDFTQLGQAIVREEQRLQQLQTKQTVVRVQYLIEGINEGRVQQSIENIRQALQGIGQVQANLDVDSSDFVRATEDVTRLERRLADIDGRRAQISANFTVRGLDDGSITQSIGNVRSALQNLSNAQVAVRVDSKAFDELGGKIVREEQRLQQLENQQTQVRVRYLVEGLNEGKITASLRNIQGLVQNLDNLRASIDINSPNLSKVIKDLQEAKQRADALTSKSLNLEVGSLRQGLQSGKVTNNTANLERFVGLLREQQRLVPINGQAFGRLGNEIQRYQRQLDGLRGASGGAAGSVGLLQSAFVGLGAAFGVVSAVDIGRRIAEAGLNAETAAVRLRSLTKAYGENGQATAAAANAAKVLGISQTEAENGISQLYASLRPTGIGLKDIETIFLSFNAAARNSGSTAQEASNAFIQLKQALGKGFLNGDELRSIGEQAPLVAQAIAETLGVSVGKLRDLGAEGKITTDVILQSLERIKGTQLTQLGEQLDTGRQKLKDFQIAAEELGKDISKALAPIGSEFLALATDFAKALAGINADPAKKKLQGVEAEVKRLQEVIELQKKLNLDTTDARKQLEELEKQLGNLNLQDANVQVANQAYEQRLKLVKQIREEEDKSRFGGKPQKLAVEIGFSVVGQDPTGLLGQLFANLPKFLPESPFKNLFGRQDFSTRALEEGAKRVEEAFRRIASGQSLNGFSQSVKTNAEEIKSLEAKITSLTKQKVELPVEAKADREQLDRQIKELENNLTQARLRVKLQVELDVVNTRLKEVEAGLAKDPKNANLLKEFNELTSAQLRYRVAIQETGNQNSAQQKIVEQLGEAFGKLATDLTKAEEALQALTQKRLKGENVDPAAYADAAKKYDELKQKLTEELGKTGISRIPEQLAQDLKALESQQPKLRVDSTAFQLVTERIALVREEIAGIEGRKALISAEFILRGLDEGTITTTINRVRTALENLNTAQATVSIDSTAFQEVTRQIVNTEDRLNGLNAQKAFITASLILEGFDNGSIASSLSNAQQAVAALDGARALIDVNSPNLPIVLDQLEEARERLGQFQSESAGQELNALRSGLSDGTVTPNLANLDRAVNLLREQQKQAALGSQEFQDAGDKIARLTALQERANGKIQQAPDLAASLASGYEEAGLAAKAYSDAVSQANKTFSDETASGFDNAKLGDQISQAAEDLDKSGNKTSKEFDSSANKLSSAADSVGQQLKEAAQVAKDRLQSAGESLKSALLGAFKFTTKIQQERILTDARAEISKAVFSGNIDSRQETKARTPEQILELAAASKAINDAAANLKNASEENLAAQQKLNTQDQSGVILRKASKQPNLSDFGKPSKEEVARRTAIFKAAQQRAQAQEQEDRRSAEEVTRIAKQMEASSKIPVNVSPDDLLDVLGPPTASSSNAGNNIVDAKKVGATLANSFDSAFAKVQEQQTLDLNAVANSFAAIVDSNQALNSQLASASEAIRENSTAVNSLVSKKWNVNVQVNAANGANTVTQLSALA